ncbi:MAG: dihydrolipoyl dehydrogenase [Spirochaetia bacterium]
MHDLIILGGGPAGYHAAERAGSLGKSVLLVEAETLGGTCLNVGCIPTKTLLHSAKLYLHAREGKRFGVTAENVSFNLAEAVSWKQKTVSTLVKGIQFQMKQHNIEVISGRGTLTGPGRIEVDGKEYRGEKVLIATGSSSAVPPIPGADGKAVMTSTEILDVTEQPESLTVIGGGYIGMEFASLFSAVGTKVTVIEMMDEIIPFMERDFASLLRKSMKKVDFHLSSRVLNIDGNTVTYEKEGGKSAVTSDIILLSVGRKPNLSGNGFDEAGLDYDRFGIKVDHRMRTNLPGVYAAGDVTGKSLLAHSAYRMADVAVGDMWNPGEQEMRYHAVPWVVFTIPEVAGCGYTEEQAKEAGYEPRTAEAPLKISGRYLAENPGERGTVKTVTDTETGQILGVQMLGTGVSELIYGAAMMIEAELRVKDIKEIIFPHPTVSEVLKDVLWGIE